MVTNQDEKERKAEILSRLGKVIGNINTARILLILDKPKTVHDIAVMIGLSLSRTSRLVSSLEKVNLVSSHYEVRKGVKGTFKVVTRNVEEFRVEFGIPTPTRKGLR